MDLTAYFNSLRGKSVGVIGIGVSNTPLLSLLLGAGIDVTACDQKEEAAFDPELLRSLREQGCRLVLGADYLSRLDQDVIFRTPGLHPRFLEDARRRGSEITSEMEAFFQVCPCPILAVTGSDGKTTTTTILSELLRAVGRTVHVGGNIGHPLLSEAGSMRPEDWAVLELSSFQLMTMERSPHIAVTTNLAPNHLDVHRDFAEYIAAKENIFTHQSAQDIAVFNADNELTLAASERAPGQVRLFSRRHPVERGTYLWSDGQNGEAIYVSNDQGRRMVLPLSGIKLPGIHNVENYMAAIAAVDGLVDDETIRTFARDFGGVEHRIELVRTLRGVRWYNDAIASSPSRTTACLNAFHSKVILLAGGKDKGISYDSLGPVINDHVKALILCGATAGVIREAVTQAENYAGLPITEVSEWAAAVHTAAELAQEGDVVVMSPASTSFDLFRNFMEKGRVFKELVNALE